jgi:hypothetical protein
VNVLILVLVVVWAALIFWTFADARRRIDDPMLVACATLASLFPFVGRSSTLIVRPPEFLTTCAARARDAAARRAASFDYQLCPHWRHEIQRTTCAARAHAKLKDAGYSCG